MGLVSLTLCPVAVIVTSCGNSPFLNYALSETLIPSNVSFDFAVMK